MYLLDTHAFVWLLTEPSKLGKVALKVIERDTNFVYVSAATVWELAIKYHLGKLPQAGAILNGLDWILAETGLKELHISNADAMVAGGLSWTHRDPFDRMIAAQALRKNLVVVSRDAKMKSCPGLQVLWEGTD